MEMEPLPKLPNWTNKYRFSDYLKRPGDTIETDKLTPRDVKRIKDAAHMWAFFNRCTVEFTQIHKDNGVAARVTLVSWKRVRKGQDDDYNWI